jgi:hypothetical protein
LVPQDAAALAVLEGFVEDNRLHQITVTTGQPAFIRHPIASKGQASGRDFARLLARQSLEPERTPRAGGVMVRMVFLLMLSLRSGRRL